MCLEKGRKMHKEARAFCERWQDQIPGHALDIGGRNVNGHCRDLWPNMQWTVLDKDIESLSITEYPPSQTHIIQADAITWESDRQYDLVLCTEVLEHTQLWRDICKTAYRALLLDGVLVLTCAGPGRVPHSAVDGAELREGEWYNNIAAVDLYSCLDDLGFRVNIESNHRAHDIYVHAVKF